MNSVRAAPACLVTWGFGVVITNLPISSVRLLSVRHMNIGRSEESLYCDLIFALFLKEVCPVVFNLSVG